MGRYQREKGARGEREVVGILKAHGLTARRTAMMQSQTSDAAPDVSIEEWPHVWMEVKRGKSVNPRAALRQAKAECAEDPMKIPVAVTRADRDEWMAFLSLTDTHLIGDRNIRALWTYVVISPQARLDRKYREGKVTYDSILPEQGYALVVHEPSAFVYMRLTDLIWLWQAEVFND